MNIATHVDKRQELGQFLTPDPIARFMASLFQRQVQDIRLLDAGAGAGALSAAAVRRWCESDAKPRSIMVTAFEIDPTIVPSLEHTHAKCETECHRAGVEFQAKVINADFIEMALPLIRGDLFAAPQTPFNTIILNPPYRKIQSNSATRLMLHSVGIEASNLYAGFLALAARLLEQNGELVAITPRSFCNGPYFKSFRKQFLAQMSLRRLHLFDSRSSAFRDDAVLQENIIVHAEKSGKAPKQVIVSTSHGAPNGDLVERSRTYAEIVSPSDPEQFIHLVTQDAQESARRSVRQLSSSLATLGLKVSTGKVVDFRARDFLLTEPAKASVPLIYPCHFHNGFVQWPLSGSRKPNAIQDAPETQNLLVDSGTYVLVKRFSSKEERRRIVAAVYDPQRIPAKKVGFENHLNYFHLPGGKMGKSFAKGLAAYLNSSVVDLYFRQFNGHTQVNAADLRNLTYPTRSQLEEIGTMIGDMSPDQAALDKLVLSVIK